MHSSVEHLSRRLYEHRHQLSQVLTPLSCSNCNMVLARSIAGHHRITSAPFHPGIQAASILLHLSSAVTEHGRITHAAVQRSMIALQDSAVWITQGGPSKVSVCAWLLLRGLVHPAPHKVYINSAV